ncbi:hypothetical protein C8J57DRAFT_1518603 [Mycena rebaudengoi]|nr:hypothetical protein C8J57DRAFT_1518603 [Mycena rebaudengoi]
MDIHNAEQQPEHPVRDERYYFSDGGLIFQCGNILYNLHKTRLLLKSEFFRDMLDIQHGVDGQDDDHPINLNTSGIVNVDFRNLLIFLYDHDEVSNPTLPYLISVLKLSKFLRIPTGVTYAVNCLPTHPDFTPATQLQLARQYEIQDWVDPAFRALIERRLSDISLADAEQIGLAAYHKLVQVKCLLADEMSGLAFNAPEVKHCSACLDEPRCSRLWEWAWWGGFGKQILHPENTKSASAIMQNLDLDHGVLSSMRRECLFRTTESIWEDNPFDDSDKEVEKASEELTAYLMGL